MMELHAVLLYSLWIDGGGGEIIVDGTLYAFQIWPLPFILKESIFSMYFVAVLPDFIRKIHNEFSEEIMCIYKKSHLNRTL